MKQTPLHADMYLHVVCVCVCMCVCAYACPVVWYFEKGYEHKMKVGRLNSKWQQQVQKEDK